jgi:hypothetical protein
LGDNLKVVENRESRQPKKLGRVEESKGENNFLFFIFLDFLGTTMGFFLNFWESQVGYFHIFREG